MQKKFILAITHAIDDQDRANAAIAFAASLLAEDADLVIFFIFEGAMLAKQGVAETIRGKNFAPVADLFPMLIEGSVPMFVCGACAKTYGITEADLVPGVRIVQIPTITAQMMERETITL